MHKSRNAVGEGFWTGKTNLIAPDFGLLLPDGMTMADEVDAQLTRSTSNDRKFLNNRGVVSLGRFSAVASSYARAGACRQMPDLVDGEVK